MAVQLAYLGDEVGGKAAQGFAGGIAGTDPAKELSGPVGGEVTLGTGGDEAGEPNVEAVDGLGAGFDQVVAVFDDRATGKIEALRDRAGLESTHRALHDEFGRDGSCLDVARGQGRLSSINPGVRILNGRVVSASHARATLRRASLDTVWWGSRSSQPDTVDTRPRLKMVAQWAAISSAASATSPPAIRWRTAASMWPASRNHAPAR